MRPIAPHLVLALLVCQVLGCGPERLVEVEVSGLTADVESLDVALWLPGLAAAEHRAVTRSLSRFYLDLAAEPAGRLRVHVDGLGRSGCRVAAGEAEAELAAGQGATIRVQLQPRDDGCQLLVRAVGDGTGEVFAEADSQRWPCAGTCGAPGRLAAGQRIMLTAKPAEGSYFAGWSGACSGTDACEVVVRGAPVQIEAAFGLRRVCEGPWCWDSPLPHGYDIAALWGAAPDDIWAVGGRGLLLHYNGSFWVRWPPVTGEPLSAIFGLREGVRTPDGPRPLLWAVGQAGTVLRFDGEAWQKEETGYPNILRAVWASGPEDAWAAGTNGLVLHWDGQSWERVPSGVRAHLNALWGRGPDDIWVAGGTMISAAPSLDVPGTLLHYDGEAWRRVYTAPAAPGVAFKGVWSSGGDDVWAVGEARVSVDPPLTRGVVARLRGGVWAMEPDAPTVTRYTAVWGRAADDVWLAGSSLLAHFDGSRYTRHPVPGMTVDDAFNIDAAAAVWGSGPDDVWAGGQGGSLLRWNGLAWRRHGGGFPGHLVDVAGSAPDNVYAVGSGGPILHFDGQTWTAVGPVENAGVLAVWVSPEGDVWAVGNSGQVMLRDSRRPSPGDWSGFGSPGGKTLVAVWGRSRDDVWAAGHDGTLLHLQPRAPFAEQVASPTRERLQALWGSAGDDIWAAGQHGAMLHYDGVAWRLVEVPTSGSLMGLWGRGRDDVWAVGWEEGPDVFAPVVLHFDGTRWERDTGTGLPAAAILFSVWGDGSGTLWVDSAYYGVLRREGTRWIADSGPLPVGHLWGTDRDHLWLVAQGGVILRRGR